MKSIFADTYEGIEKGMNIQSNPVNHTQLKQHHGHLEEASQIEISSLMALRMNLGI